MGLEMIAFERNFAAPYDRLVPVAPGIRRLLARNPGPFTFKGTGVYVLGQGSVAVIDPGPDDPAHLRALRQALAGETVTHILVTHTHRDHSPAARALKAWTGAPIYGYGPHASAGHAPGIAVEEGGDREFVPDIVLRDGDRIEGRDFAIACVHTPGHLSNHPCFALSEEKALFTGDHIMGWSTTAIAPPDGNMGDYLASLRKLLPRDDLVYWPTHGGPIREPQSFAASCLAHRLEREAQILAGLKAGVVTIPALVERIYAGLDANLKPAAGLTVLAHLLQMVKEGRVTCDGVPAFEARFETGRTGYVTGGNIKPPRGGMGTRT
jgi:glyoxylase-like metal-dependent hydrolase (beta-lactamase superfamily II)